MEGRSNQAPIGGSRRNKWTRVICCGDGAATEPDVWQLEQDLEDESVTLQQSRGKSVRDWAPLFLAADYLATGPVLELQQHTLKDRKMRMLGERVSRHRENILEKAREQAVRDNKCLEAGAKEVKIHGQKVRARGSDEQRTPADAFEFSYKEPTSVDTRSCRRAGSKLSLLEKITIVHQAVCLKYLHKDIAKEHRITVGYVSLLQRRAMKNPKFIAELVGCQQQSEQHRGRVREVVEQLNQQDVFIDSVGSLEERLREKHDIVAKPRLISSVLREDLRMKYKLV